MISDFQFDIQKLKTVSIKHDVIAIQVTDPIEHALPNVGRMTFSSLETDQEITVNTGRKKVRDAYASRASEWQEQVNQELRALSIDKISVKTDEDFIPALHGFFKRREGRH